MQMASQYTKAIWCRHISVAIAALPMSGRLFFQEKKAITRMRAGETHVCQRLKRMRVRARNGYKRAEEAWTHNTHAYQKRLGYLVHTAFSICVKVVVPMGEGTRNTSVRAGKIWSHKMHASKKSSMRRKRILR
eukprot:IDg14996t1